MTTRISLTLNHLTHSECPVCGKKIVAIRVTGTHCDGDQFEEVAFDCGGRIRWSPNFQREESVTYCPNLYNEFMKLKGKPTA